MTTSAAGDMRKPSSLPARLSISSSPPLGKPARLLLHTAFAIGWRRMIARVLTIAGSDSSGGAGIQADLKTFTVFRVYGMSAITALTAQNTQGGTGIMPVAPDFVTAQIRSVLGDIGADAAKTGMLATAPIV